MVHYKNKTFFENKYNLNKLIEFRNLVTKYFKHSHTDTIVKGKLNPFGRGELIESKEEKSIRSKINKLIPSIDKIILESDVSLDIVYSFSLASGKGSISLNLLSNIFNLKKYNIPIQELIDHIDRAIGVYSDDKILSIIRTFNPIFWFTRLLDFIFNIPFSLLEQSGFNTQKIKNNFLTKIIRLIYNCVMFLASVLTVLSLLGYLEKIKEIFYKISLIFCSKYAVVIVKGRKTIEPRKQSLF